MSLVFPQSFSRVSCLSTTFPPCLLSFHKVLTMSLVFPEGFHHVSCLSRRFSQFLLSFHKVFTMSRLSTKLSPCFLRSHKVFTMSHLSRRFSSSRVRLLLITMTTFLHAFLSIAEPHSSVSVQFVTALVLSSQRARCLPIFLVPSRNPNVIDFSYGFPNVLESMGVLLNVLENIISKLQYILPKF